VTGSRQAPEETPVKKLLFLHLLLCLVLAGCHVPVQQYKPVVEDAGETYLYVRPLARGTDRVRFDMEGLSAVRDDGVEVALPLRFSSFSRDELQRQRLLCAGPLPAGGYRGFSVKVKSASLKRDDGTVSALLIKKDEAARVDFPFEVKKGKGLLIALSFDPEKSVRGVGFAPVFTAAIPMRPVPSLTGYATNFAANTITVFDKHAAEAVDIIQTGRGPAGIVLDPKQLKAYFVLSGEDAIDVIDVASGSVINRIRLSPGDAPRDLALTPDGNTLITVNPGSSTASFIDPQALVETTRLNLVYRPDSVMLDRTGKRAYVFDRLNNKITLLDVPSRSVVTTFATETAPIRGDFNKKGDQFIMFYEWFPYLVDIDTTTLLPIKRIYDEIGIGWLKVDTANDKIYVGKLNSPLVEIYDPFSFFRTDMLVAGGGVSFMTIDGEENRILFLLPRERRLQFVNLVTKKIVGEIDLDDVPYWVTLMGER
jgi:hypothetical protein